MIDAPGPWGSGPFILAEGYSSLDNERATISRDPFAATWLPTREDRTPQLRLAANTSYWDKTRGPRLEGVIFRSGLSPGRALELVCTTEGEVDILTEVPPEHARYVEESEQAELVSIDAMRCVVGVINRDAQGLPLGHKRARQALNLAVDRGRSVREGIFGRAQPLAGLMPPSAVTALHRLSPYAHDPSLAAAFWREAVSKMGGAADRPLRLASMVDLERVTRIIASDLREALGIEVEVRIYPDEEKLGVLRRLAEKRPRGIGMCCSTPGATYAAAGRRRTRRRSNCTAASSARAASSAPAPSCPSSRSCTESSWVRRANPYWPEPLTTSPSSRTRKLWRFFCARRRRSTR